MIVCGLSLCAQDEDLDYAHMELNHNLTEGHSTFTLISELQNPCMLA